jgi:hypothetical protein
VLGFGERVQAGSCVELTRGATCTQHTPLLGNRGCDSAWIKKLGRTERIDKTFVPTKGNGARVVSVKGGRLAEICSRGFRQ